MASKPRPIGPSEAAVLSVLLDSMTINQICDRLEGDGIDDAGVYLTLKRLVDRGLVSRCTVSRVAADGKRREVGEYTRLPGAMEALRDFHREVAPIVQRIAAAGSLV